VVNLVVAGDGLADEPEELEQDAISAEGLHQVKLGPSALGWGTRRGGRVGTRPPQPAVVCS